MGKRVDTGVKVSLFPFLSILAALIGTLVVIIAAMAIAQLGKVEAQEPEDVSRADLAKEIEKEIVDLAKAQETLQDILNRITESNTLTLKLRNEQSALELDKEKDDKKKDDKDALRNELLAAIAVLQKENKTLATDYEQLLAEILALQALLKDRQAAPEKPPVRIQPGGSARNKKASFVEIASKTVILHRKNGEAIRVPAATLKTDENFRKLLEHVDAQPYRTLTFLIRGTPDSMTTFREADKLVSAFAANEGKRKNLRAGRLPVPGEGNIDLSVFAEFME
ncbi:MAG: hypothetical protein ACI8UO_000337 [Verrucomicrobiales bacterium]|jgi:hypothetical protein